MDQPQRGGLLQQRLQQVLERPRLAGRQGDGKDQQHQQTAGGAFATAEPAAAAAAARQDDAHAEQQPAQHGGQDRHLLGGKTDEPCRLQPEEADRLDGDSQQQRQHETRISLLEQLAETADEAELAALQQKAERQPHQKAAQWHDSIPIGRMKQA